MGELRQHHPSLKISKVKALAKGDLLVAPQDAVILQTESKMKVALGKNVWVSFFLLVTRYFLLVAPCVFTRYFLLFTRYFLLATRYFVLVTRYSLLNTGYLSTRYSLICYSLHFTRHILFATH